MQSSVLSRLLLVGGFSCLLAFTPLPAWAADKDEKKDKKDEAYTDVKFETSDQVELRGRWYASAKGKKAPAVLVLPKLLGDISQDGWDRLAETLAKEGYSVLLFDYRGHGKSTTVSPDFWKARDGTGAYNANLYKRMLKATPPETIDIKDFKNGYLQYIVNDIAAARLFLDRRNDRGECNTGDLIVIGAEDGACLGEMFLFSEYYRHRLNAIGKPDTNSEGKDIACAIWLSYRRTLGDPKGNPPNLNPKDWFGLVGHEKKVPMAFVYGDDDKAGEAFAQEWVKYIKAKDSKDNTGHKLTGPREIEKAGKVVGNELLQKNLKTQDWIVKEYLKKVMDQRSDTEWTQREVDKNAYIWSLAGTIRPPIAKVKDQKDLNPIPFHYFIKQ